ncbi:MAG: bifunctional homocysteine S-methyltransferase/methylenetetrahydrofolate reductase [Deltaproteobacteria bacterium]|nr:bifunctional homocysteine S-methyltransferase/methylenetetrahydrofolate reductase [Deltaproteobacteria bacterium]
MAELAARPDFRVALERGDVILFDGAMGTTLYARGVFINRPFEELNLTQPDVVRDVHAAYLDAGADVLETNTFTANRFRLSPHGLEGQVAEINRAGVELARSAASGRAWVAGAMGPLGVRIEPFGPIAKDEAAEVFTEQAQALADAGVDLFVLETFSHLPEILVAVRAIRAISSLPIVAQVAVGAGGLTREGVKAGEAATKLADAGADVVGVNCSDALSTLSALAGMRSAVDVPLSCQPNAGTVRDVEGRKLYLGSPEYFVAWGRRAVGLGTRLLGGCCGTGPEHIRALRTVLGEVAPVVPHEKLARIPHRTTGAEPVPTEEKSVISAALHNGRFVTAVEVPPVRGWETDDLQRAARQLALAGVTAMTIPEGPGAIAHLPPFAQAELCRRAGVAAIIHYSARGRRLLRMQSDLLGAASSGVTDLLLITGDPMSPGSEQDTLPDLEVDSIGLVNLVARLNHGEDVGGNAIGRPTGFHIGVHLDPTAFDAEREKSRYFWKVDAGAEYAITGPVFDPEVLARCVAALPAPKGRKTPVIATIWPLTSATQAELFEHQRSAVPVPAPLVERMRAAEAAGTEESEGLLIARELVAAVRPLVQGIQVVAPNGRVDLALQVLEAARA